MTLGILPGAGGTQRLPRLVGIEAALRIILWRKFPASWASLDAASRKMRSLKRCMLALMNGGEGLRDGVANRAGEIDIVHIYRYGFPAYRGGPMFWSEHGLGLQIALEKMRGYAAEQQVTPYKKIFPLLEQLVAEGRGPASMGA